MQQQQQSQYPLKRGQQKDDGNSSGLTAAGSVVSVGSTSLQRRKRLRHSLAQIYKHVARQLNASDMGGRPLYQDDQIMSQLISYVRETRTFLAESGVIWEWEHQPLRTQFCGLVEALYYFLSSPSHQAVLPKAARRFTHETRSGLYQLFERWCGIGRYSESTREIEQRMVNSALDSVKDVLEKTAMAGV
ncbi:Cell morphogenesis protein PAG1, partial [Linderina macrospora]